MLRFVRYYGKCHLRYRCNQMAITSPVSMHAQFCQIARKSQNGKRKTQHFT